MKINSSFDFDLRYSTLLELLRWRATHQPKQYAYTFLTSDEFEISFTYEQVDHWARAIAAHLQSLSAIGERALLLYPPGLEFIAAFFGCLYAGVIAVPAYPPRRNQKLSRLEALAADSGAKIALTTANLLSTIQTGFTSDSILSRLSLLPTDSLDQDLANSWRPPDIAQSDLAFLQYTSGSTGMPKGVMVSHGNLLHNLSLIQDCFGHNAQSRGVIWLPPYHDMGLIGGVLQPLYAGFPVFLMSPVDFLQKPRRWLQAISRYRATTSGGPNFAYDLVCRKVKPQDLTSLDLSSWEVAFNGAEPVRAETLDRFTETFAPCGFRREVFYPCYGMAETTLIVSGGGKTEAPTVHCIDSVALESHRIEPASSEVDQRWVVSSGRPCPKHNLVVVNPETHLPCSEKHVGEIWVAGPSVAQGYWSQIDKTREVFQAYLADTGAGPFLRTGDLGFLQEGELFVTGRLKDIIIIRGQNHYPQDIELTVESSHPALRKGCGAAFSIDIKGVERLVIVQEVERSYLRQLSAKELLGDIRQAVAAQHDLQVYATALIKTGGILKTSSGKVRRSACRAAFLKNSLPVVEDWSENPQFKAKFQDLAAEVDALIKRNRLSSLTKN